MLSSRKFLGMFCMLFAVTLALIALMPEAHAAAGGLVGIAGFGMPKLMAAMGAFGSAGFGRHVLMDRYGAKSGGGGGGGSDDPEQIKKALDRISDEVKEHAVKAQKEVERHGQLLGDTKASVDKVLTEQATIRERLQDVEQKLAKGGGGDEDGPGESLRGVLEKAFEGESEIKDFIASRSLKKQVNIPISRKALLGTSPSGQALNYPGQQIQSTPLVPLLRRLTIRDLLMPGRTSKPVVFYPRETGFTNNAAPVSEGALKPKSDLTIETITGQVVTLAHLFDVSLQMLDDVDYLESYIEARGRYGLKLKEEGQLLNGSGTGNNLEGLKTIATPYVQPAGAVVQGETVIDRLRLMLLQVELAEAYANGIILHPTNWANIELLKDGELRYLFTNPQNTTTGRIWGRDVVSTQAQTLDEGTVGDFAMSSQILDRQDANVAISFENKDNFERNMATIRIEERLAVAHYRPEAIVDGSLDVGT